MQANQTKTDNQSTVQKKENTQEEENKLKNSLLSEESLSNNPFLAQGQTSNNPWVNPNQTSTNPFLPKDAISVNPWINPNQVSTNPFLPVYANSVNPFTPIQKKENKIQLKENTSDTNTSASKMPSETESKMSDSFGVDFSRVNIHKDSDKASELNALAFTQGSDIYFAKGQYDDKSPKGLSLLGHELTHVVQQSEGKVQPTTQMKGVNVNDDSSPEAEADLMGEKVIQAKWKNDTKTLENADEAENHLKLPKDKLEAEDSLSSNQIFLVPKQDILTQQIQSGNGIRIVPMGKHIIGESEHGSDTWNNATAPWTYVPKMREKYKTYEKPDEKRITEADTYLEGNLGGEKRKAVGDLALEGHDEYAISALSIAQQLLKGYYVEYDNKNFDFFEMLDERILEVQIVLLRYQSMGIRLIEKANLTPKENLYIEIARYISDSKGFEFIKEIVKDKNSNINEREVAKLGDFLNKHWHGKVKVIQELVNEVIPKIIQINQFQNMGSLIALNKGTEGDKMDWDKGVNSAITSPATRNIREDEMARRIKTAPEPLFVQVGKAHIPGLIQKGVDGRTYADENIFIKQTTKKIKTVYDARLEKDAIKHRSMNFWG